MEEKEEVGSTTSVSKHAAKASGIYPEATKGTYGSTLETAKPIGESSDKGSNNPLAAIVLFVVGLALGLILGRTVLKAPPSFKEATEVMFGEAIDEFADQLEANE